MALAFVIIAVLLIVLGGLLTAIDSAFSSVGKNDLIEEAAAKRKPQALHRIAADLPAHLTALRFVRVVVDTIAAVLITLAASMWLSQWWQVLLVAGAIMTGVSFVVVGSSPRAVGARNAPFMVRTFGGLVRGVRLAVGPLAEGLVVLGNVVTPGVGGTATVTSENQFRNWVDEATERDMLEEEDRELLHSVFDFGDTIVREIMVARTDMITVDAEDSINDVMTVFLDRGVSRMPVIGKDSDEVIGICYLRDVARVKHEKPAAALKKPIATLAKPALFIPESKNADDTLRFLQREQNHLAMVVDEYGGIAGLVTLEDLIEELLGEISDEYDTDVDDMYPLGPDRYRVSAKYAVDDLEDLYDIDIDEEDVDTVGGLLTKLIGRLPEGGSTASTQDLILVAEQPEGRHQRVSWIRVSPTEGWLERKAVRAEIDQASTGEVPLP
jgi:CBS domain containing-hemolysin-like protein